MLAGKFVESILWNSPPPPLTVSPGFCSVRYTHDAGVSSISCVPPVMVGGEAVAFRMYGLGEGVEAKMDASTPKFLARMDLGVCVIQSSTLKVVPTRSKSASSKLGDWSELKGRLNGAE